MESTLEQMVAAPNFSLLGMSVGSLKPTGDLRCSAQPRKCFLHPTHKPSLLQGCVVQATLHQQDTFTGGPLSMGLKVPLQATKWLPGSTPGLVAVCKDREVPLPHPDSQTLTWRFGFNGPNQPLSELLPLFYD